MVTRTTWAICALVAGVIVFTGAPARAGGRTSNVVVVANASVKESDLSLIALREMVMGQRRFWSNGERIELIVESADTPARRVFVEQLSGMTEAQFQHYWTSLIFSHRATRPPRKAPDRRLALALVNAIPGALALVEDGIMPDNVRVISVNGLLPGAEGYPLE